MHKKFEINWTMTKGGCQSGRKVVTQNSKSDLPLVKNNNYACNKISNFVDFLFFFFFVCFVKIISKENMHKTNLKKRNYFF